MAKSLFIFTFLFLFLLDLLHRKECGKVSHHSHMIGCHRSHHMVSHDEYGRIVHRPCSSCISSVENPTGTIEFSLSNADKGAVGLIPALELASLTAVG